MTSGPLPQNRPTVAPSTELWFREGGFDDLRATFEVAQVAVSDTARRMGVRQAGLPTPQEVEREWARHRGLLEFIATELDGRYWVCEDQGAVVGYGRVCRFGAMEELTELMVLPGHQGKGIGRALLERCWPGDPTPDVGRVVVAAGAPADLSLYSRFGVMPTTGHWHLQASTAEYEESRSHEIDATEPGVHALEAGRAVEEWNRLEPPAIGHRRPKLHEFFSRNRTCLATMDESTGRAIGLCWVGSHCDIGPAVAATPEELVPVLLAALDRVAKTKEPATISLFCATDSWWVLRRLRGLGFRVHWPSWVMASLPLPGLDRYLPTRPPHLL
jgi:GNAT superfamily N-acetyltransferase